MCCIITVAVGVYVYKHREHHEKEHVKTVELHRDWRVMQTMSKRMYYFNPETGETSWTPPSNAKVVEAPNAVTDGEGHYLPPGWHEGEHEGEGSGRGEVLVEEEEGEVGEQGGGVEGEGGEACNQVEIGAVLDFCAVEGRGEGKGKSKMMFES